MRKSRRYPLQRWCLGLTVILALVAGRDASAAPPATPLRVSPASVSLVGPRSQQGLVVSAPLQGGGVWDISAQAVLKVTPGSPVRIVTQDDRRVLQPTGNGAGAVLVSAPGSTTVRVPVRVTGADQDQPVSFRHEVVPALTKLGCNMGTCHGTPTGKGGFRLSLQGYAPDLDYTALALEGNGRRVNRTDPGRSLMLLKAMVDVPHGGGKRLFREMPEFDVLVRWIAEGVRQDPPGTVDPVRLEFLPGKRTLKLPNAAHQQTAVQAVFPDGSSRDVTHLAKLTTSNEDAAVISRGGMVEASEKGEIAVIARYGDLIQSTRLTYLRDVPGFKWVDPPVQNFVDGHVYNRLRLFQIPPSGLSTDAEFLRRAYLDTCGLLPTADEVRAFMADRTPDKRARLIDRLTERPEFADQWALRWADVLRIQDETMKESGARAFHRWVRDSFAANKPMDRFVSEILTASGPGLDNPPANFFRTFTAADDFSQATSQLFMGVRITCAKCHNHPFERWTQDDYYSLAAFFAQVRTRGARGGDEMVYQDQQGQVTHLRTGRVMRPKMLGGEFAEVAPGEDRRKALAAWLTGKGNPFFARSIVNRTWSNLLGRGIVEPIDDFRDSNPPVNEELLNALAVDFAASGFDFRHLVRTIMKSRTYQLSSEPVALNRDDQTYFSHSLTRLLGAEQLLDSISQFTGVPEQYPDHPGGTRAMQLAGTKARTPFLKIFGRPDRNLNCECEREKDPNLFQALALISGRGIQSKLSHPEGRFHQLARSGKSPEQVLDEIYLAALARTPTPKESRGWLAYFARSPERTQAYEDLGWVLINSKEFLFRR